MGEKTCLYTGFKRYATLHVANHTVCCVTQETNKTLSDCSFTKHSCAKLSRANHCQFRAIQADQRRTTHAAACSG